jgi:hypothetical protein
VTFAQQQNHFKIPSPARRSLWSERS